MQSALVSTLGGRSGVLLVATLGLLSGCAAGDAPDAIAAAPSSPSLAAATNSGGAAPAAVVSTTTPSAAGTTSTTTTTTTTTTSPGPPAATEPATTAPTPASTTATTPAATSTTTETSSPTTTATTSTTSTSTTTVPPRPMSSCEQVVHIGDSTGVYLWEQRFVGAAEYTMGERYRAVGVDAVFPDNSGGRAIHERHADWQTTALEVAVAAKEGGYSGCWVLMVGTNDAANVAAGSTVDHAERIVSMLAVIGDDPVLWVDAVTDGWVTGAYGNESMRAWNNVLLWIASERPNVKVLRWSELVSPDWFADDGIHYTTDGHVWRAVITAVGLAEAFPA